MGGRVVRHSIKSFMSKKRNLLVHVGAGPKRVALNLLPYVAPKLIALNLLPYVTPYTYCPKLIALSCS